MTAAGLGLLCWLAACSGASRPAQQGDNAQLQQQAAQATEKARDEAQDAAIQARRTADDAAEKLRAVAAGVKEGMQSPTPERTQGMVDINSASRTRLETLPGVDDRVARRVIADRPYRDGADLVKKGVLSDSEYKRIEDRITAQ